MTAQLPLHILYIEDSPGEARLMEKHLTRAGYMFTWAREGEEGLLHFEAGGFDVVVVDHSLPGLAGLDVLRILLEKDPLLPVIMVTGRGDEQTAVKAMKLGAQDYIVKDIDRGFMELLPAVIEQSIGRQQLILDKQRVEDVAQRREAILEAVNFTAEQLLRTSSWQSQMHDILARLGQAADVSRVYLVENGQLSEGEYVISCCYEWTAPDILPRTAACQGKTYEDIGLTSWISAFKEGQLIHGLVAELPEPERINFQRQYVLSMIAVPIFVGATWQGFIGFDDCRTERVWETAEIDALRTPANILGAAWQREQTETALYQAQRLESVGLLAGGIAHDFNNLLTGILSQSSLALLKLPAGSSVKMHVEKTIVASEAAADLVKQLLGYAGKGHFQIRSIDLNQLIETSKILLESSLRKRAVLELDLTSTLAIVEADSSQMQQVIMSLVMNAAEAVGQNQGAIQIRTQSLEITEPLITVGNHELKPGFYVCLEVKDNGKGIPSEILPRIFEPFFSTKEMGRGLGLAATLGIVQAHGGGILAESDPERGSRFRIFLPASEKQVEPRLAHQAKTENKMARILVIDDEQAIRDAVTDGLSMFDIEVVAAENGREGIEIYQQDHQNIALVLLDMQMPDLNGHQTFERLRMINAQVKVILSSGYSEADTMREFAAGDIVAFLQKPYRFEKLMGEVKVILG